MTEVRPRHLHELVLALRADGKVAPRTIRHVYATLRTMFHDAVAFEVIDVTPCVLERGVLPKKVDKDPNWRHTAIFGRHEVETLIADLRILPDRRVLHALKALAGLRHAEAAELTWAQIDTNLEPLGGILLGKTKSGVPRRVPIHPVLARVLSGWAELGWERAYGRRHTPEDLVVPARTLAPRNKADAAHAFRADLETLGLRTRRGHDLRRTFISLALEDGARRDLLETVSHGPRGDIISVYSTFPWPALCAEVAKLEIAFPEGREREFPTAERKAANRWRKVVTPPGLEPCETPFS